MARGTFRISPRFSTRSLIYIFPSSPVLPHPGQAGHPLLPSLPILLKYFCNRHIFGGTKAFIRPCSSKPLWLKMFEPRRHRGTENSKRVQRDEKRCKYLSGLTVCGMCRAGDCHSIALSPINARGDVEAAQRPCLGVAPAKPSRSTCGHPKPPLTKSDSGCRKYFSRPRRAGLS